MSASRNPRQTLDSRSQAMDLSKHSHPDRMKLDEPVRLGEVVLEVIEELLRRESEKEE